MAGFPEPGRQLGPYQLVREIGQGDLGVVFEATDDATGLTVAVKVLTPPTELAESARTWIVEDLDLLTHADSRSILQVRDVAQVDGRLVVVTPYLARGNLANRLRRGPLSRKSALSFGAQLTRALAAAHEVGVLHDGIKPTNVLRREEDGLLVPVLADFGEAIRAQDWVVPGGASGSVAFVAPERLQGAQPDPGTDVYSMGCLLHAMLAGAPPAPGAAPAIPVVDDVDRALQDILVRALERDPSRRLADAATMAGELEALAVRAQVDHGAVPVVTPVVVPAEDATETTFEPDPRLIQEPAPAPVEDAVEEAPRTSRRRRVPAVLLGVAGLATVVALGSLWWGQHNGDHDGAPAAKSPTTPKTTPRTTPAAATTPKAPTLAASPAYRAVVFHVARADGGSVEVDSGSGWKSQHGRRVVVDTAAGGERACLRARAVSSDGARHSRVVRRCATSQPPSVTAVRVSPDCVIDGIYTQVCYQLDARGFRSDSDPALSFDVDGVQVGTITVHIDSDGRGSLPGGQHFHFDDSDAGRTAHISMGGASYSWQIPSRQ